MLAPNTLLQNRYLIVRSIGHGGMGAVYLARDQRLGNTVALKETFFTEERMRKAFEREARLLAHLRHPALPKVTDHFEEDGGQFIVMEFISGDDLEMLLAQRGKPFEVEEVLAWADELLRALDYLHKQEPPILHRDIKPANLKLTPQSEIILLDFGLAKGTAGQTSSVMTSRSVFGFTPNFAPLEQIQGTGTGPRSDLYSLGATLYYLMTGMIPPDALTRITEVANGQPDPLRRPDEANPQIPRGLADLLMKTMAHNRDQRPKSAAEMRRALREISPSFASSDAREFKVSDDERQTILPSTLIEHLPAGSVLKTGSSQAHAEPTAEPTTELETAQDVTPRPTKKERASLRLPWAIAGFVVLLLAGITIGLVSNFTGSETAAIDKAQNVAAKDDNSTAAPVVTQKVSAAPDDSEISTSRDASGAEVKTRTFKSHPLVSKVMVTTRDGKQTAKVVSTAGEERELPDAFVATALDATGDSLASAVGFVAEKGKPIEQQKVASKSVFPPAKAQGRRVQTGLAVPPLGMNATKMDSKNQAASVSQEVQNKTPDANSIGQQATRALKKDEAQPRASRPN